MKRSLFAAAALTLLTTAAQAQVSQEDPIAFANRDCNQWAAVQDLHVTPGSLSPVILKKLRQKEFASNLQYCETRKQFGKEKLAAKEAADRQAVALAAQRREQERVEAVRQEHQQEEARAQAIEAAKPINRLYRGYQYYAHVKFCNEVREGHLVKYVNDVEMERAETAIKAVVEQTTKEDASIDTDDIWKKALKAVSGRYAEIEVCKASLIQLFKLSPQPVYQIAKP
jgi:hypothetical protein